MRSVYGVSARYAAERRGRTLLTGAGIALGVAVLFATLLIVASVDSSLDELVEGFAGGADVVATPTGGIDAPVPSGIADETGALDGVDASATVFGFPTAVGEPSDPTAVFEDFNATNRFGLQVLGVDAESARDIYPFEVDDGRLYSEGTREAVLPRPIADELGVGVGDVVVVATPRGRAGLTVTGLLGRSGAGSYNDGSVVYTSLETARDLAGAHDEITLLALRLDPGIDLDAWIREYRGSVDPRLDLQPASEVYEPIRTAVRGFGSTLTVLASIVLFVAGFLVYLTLSTSVATRRSSIGVLRAVGTSRSQIRGIVLAEALFLGGCATVVGLGVGAGLASLLLALVEPVPGLPTPMRLVVTPWALVVPVVLGVGVSALGATIPAGRAASLDPVETLRNATRRRRATGAWVLGLALIALSIGVFRAAAESTTLTAIALFMLLTGAVLLAPILLPLLARLTLWVGGAFRGATVLVVVAHLMRERTRSAYTLALAMIALAMAFAMGAVQTSFAETAERQLSAQFDADLTVYAAASFDDGFLTELGRVDGVETASPTWWGWSEVTNDSVTQRVRLRIVDPARYFDVAGFDLSEGDDSTLSTALYGRGVLLPGSLAGRLAVAVGDTVTFATPAGAREFTVTGIFESVGSSRSADQFSAPVVGIASGRRIFGVGQPTEVQLAVDASADTAETQGLIEERLGSRYSFKVETAREVGATTRAQLRQLTGVLGGFVVLAGIVAGLGLANTLAVSLMERTREIGVLRAIGADRDQVRTMAIFESAVLVVVALVLAIPLGAAMSRPVVELASTSFGSELAYVYPVQWVPVALGAAAIIAVLAAAGPARRAARLEVVTALRYE